MRYTDEEITYWGEIYCKERMIRHDISFAVFMQDPRRWLEWSRRRGSSLDTPVRVTARSAASAVTPYPLASVS